MRKISRIISFVLPAIMLCGCAVSIKETAAVRPRPSAAEKIHTQKSTSAAAPSPETESVSGTEASESVPQSETAEDTGASGIAEAAEIPAETEEPYGGEDGEPDESGGSDRPNEQDEAPGSTDYDIRFFDSDLFIGDSIMTGLFSYGYLDTDHVFAKIGLNPDSAASTEINGRTPLTLAQERLPRRIYIMLGSNGISYMGSVYMTNKMKQLARSLEQASPDSGIYIISIPPVTEEHDSAGTETMDSINEYNGMLKYMADEIGAVFLDLCSELKNSSGYFSSLYAEADGMHFLGSAYKRMLSFIQSSVTELGGEE